MTPQERELIEELFDRLSTLETAPRDAAAERAIADGLSRAPNALYPLVQTVLVQDEALKRANARLEELEGGAPPNSGFLDNMRNALFGREDSSRGSVPSVRAGSPYDAPGMGPGMGQGMGPGMGGMGPGMAPGGSFLGNAAATAAGVIGGSLLLGGIRSMFGHGQSFAGASEPGRSPWDNSAAGSDLARQAGVDDVGGSGRRDAGDSRSGLFDTAEADDGDYDSDFDDGGFDSGDVG